MPVLSFHSIEDATPSPNSTTQRQSAAAISSARDGRIIEAPALLSLHARTSPRLKSTLFKAFEWEG
jgi:hypothetical protein